MRNPPPPLTDAERGHLRAALCYLHAQVGSWVGVAAAVRSKRVSLRRVRAGHRIRGMRHLAVRVSRLAGVPVGAVLGGHYPPAGVCQHCGKKAG